MSGWPALGRVFPHPWLLEIPSYKAKTTQNSLAKDFLNNATGAAAKQSTIQTLRVFIFSLFYSILNISLRGKPANAFIWYVLRHSDFAEFLHFLLRVSNTPPH